ncbi:MAG: N-methyl-L-tryptophan oxidase [Sporichthyaceae bacterium]|nr:N-methyl-L-tryptophan oxidase [Sporichthyaceae bacterium]
MPTYDVVVAGLGGFGSAAASHLARRGQRVLGLDPRPAAHAEGSSHGESRIVRQAYYEGASYVPLLLRTYELWAALARDGEPLLRRTGGLFMGASGTQVLEGSVATARTWDLEHEVLDAADLARRFPALSPPAGTLGLYEPQAGVVGPEAAVAAHLAEAADAGAELRHDEAVTGWVSSPDRVLVATTRGHVGAGALVLAPGRWAPDLLGDLELPLVVERRVQHWFVPSRAENFVVGRLPVWMWDLADGTLLYGVPELSPGGGVKAAVHFSGGTPAADWTPAELAATLATLLPGLGDRRARATDCWYTLTPDRHFVVGWHPGGERVLLACGFSGHGFKFTPVLGEVLADLVVDGATSFDLSLFAPERFASTSPVR